MEDLFTAIDIIAGVTGNETLSGISSGIQATIMMIGCVITAIGLLQCFWGYKIFKIFIGINGFIFGYLVGGILYNIVTDMFIANSTPVNAPVAPTNLLVSLLFGSFPISLIVGIIGVKLAFKIYKLGVFIGTFIPMLFTSIVFITISPQLGMLVLLLSIIISTLAVLFTVPVIILSTTFSGSLFLSKGFALILENDGIGIVIGFLFFIIGFIVQFKRENYNKSNLNTGLIKKNILFDELKENGSKLNLQTSNIFDKAYNEIQNIKLNENINKICGSIRNTKTIIYSENKILVKNDYPLWIDTLPIVITKAFIVNTKDDNIALELGFQNISDEKIVGVFFRVDCYNLLNEKLECIDKLSIQDINISSGDFWFSKQHFLLTNKDTRRIKVVIKNIVMKNGSIWSNEENIELSQLENQKELELPVELKPQFFRSCRNILTDYNPEKIFIYQPENFEQYWNCSCGQMNLGEKCIACGILKHDMFQLYNTDYLNKKLKEYCAEKEKIEQIKKEKIEEQKKIMKDNVSKFSKSSKQSFRNCKSLIFKALINAKNCSINIVKNKIIPNKKKVIISIFSAICIFLLFSAISVAIKQIRIKQEEVAYMQVMEEEEQKRLQKIEDAKIKQLETEERTYKEIATYLDIDIKNVNKISKDYSISKVLNDKNLIIVYCDGLYGCIDYEGNVIIDFKYDSMEKSSDGLILVSQNKKYGCIDYYGNVTIPLKYDWLGTFSENLALAYINDKYGYIDINGNTAIEFQYDYAGKFNEGLAPVCKNNKYGYIDKLGQAIIPLQFDYAQPFSNGLAIVVQRKEVDTNYDDIISMDIESFGYSILQPCKYNLSWLTEIGSYGYIDKTGEVIIPFEYDSAENFNEDLAIVCKDNKYGYIDKIGQAVTPFEYDSAKDFSEGLAVVCKDNKYGYIDKTGEVIIPFEYDSAENFSEGLAVVCKDNKYGYIDKTGQAVTPFEYDSAQSFTEGLATIWQNDKYGCIDISMNKVIPVNLDDIILLKNNYVYIKLDDYQAICKLN